MRALGCKAKDTRVSTSNESMLELPALSRLEAAFLESVLPLRAFAHLTTLDPMTADALAESYRAWTGSFQAYHRFTLGWVRSIEFDPQPHIHAALVASRPLDCEYAARLWRQMIAPRYADAAKVEPYRRGLCGLGYILKEIHSPRDCIQFSANLAAFGRGQGKSLFPTNAAQRRQQRRIKEQFERPPPLCSPNFIAKPSR
jgi:hypothetical protein